MKQLIVGTYYMGNEQAQLVLREGTGGEMWVSPEKGSVARIKIGADEPVWHRMLATLLHEVFELVLWRKGVRFSPCNSMTEDHARYLFVATHNDFSDVCATSGDYLAACIPDAMAAWKAWGKASRLNAKARAVKPKKRKGRAKS